MHEFHYSRSQVPPRDGRYARRLHASDLADRVQHSSSMLQLFLAKEYQSIILL